MNKKKVLKLLYRSLDAPLGRKDQERLQRGLSADPELRRTREGLLALRRDVAGARTGAFRPGFVERTMARARSEGLVGGADPGFLPVIAGMAPRFAVAALILVVAAASYLLISGEIIPRDAVYYVSNLSLDRILTLSIF
jgi:hypothetical protein